MKATLSLSRPGYFAKHGFKTTRFEAFKLKNKLVMVIFDYSAPPEFKYSQIELYGSRGDHIGSRNIDYVYVEFAFNSAPKYRLFNLRVAPYFVIKLESEEYYSYLYSRQSKYGIVVYFAPDEFETMNGAKPISAEIV